MKPIFCANESDIHKWKCLFLDYFMSDNLKFNKSYQNILVICGRNLDFVGNPSKYSLSGFDIEDVGPPDFIYDETYKRITRKLVHRNLTTFEDFKSVALGYGDFHRHFDVALFNTLTPYIRESNYYYDIDININESSDITSFRGPIRQFYGDCLRHGLISFNHMFDILCGKCFTITIKRLEKIK